MEVSNAYALADFINLNMDDNKSKVLDSYCGRGMKNNEAAVVLPNGYTMMNLLTDLINQPKELLRIQEEGDICECTNCFRAIEIDDFGLDKILY